MGGNSIPAISGMALIDLFVLDGWTLHGDVAHGVLLTKYDPNLGRERLVTIPRKRKSLPKNTLHCILSVKQSGLGRRGLLKLIEKHGMP